MSVSAAADGTILLSGRCGPDDAEALLVALLADRAAVVDWTGCEAAHAAVVQVLLAVRPSLRGPPASTFLAGLIPG